VTEVQPDNDVLTNAGWQRLLTAARRKLERTGGELTGSIGITNPTDAERRVVIGITGRHRSAEVTRLQVDLLELDRALYASYQQGLLATLTPDGPLHNRPAQQADEESAKAVSLADAQQRCVRHRDEPWFIQWLEQLSTDGTATRLIRRDDRNLLGQAAEVLNRLPADGVPIPVLAEQATGNTKALAGTPLETLVLRALALRDAVPAPVNRVLRMSRLPSQRAIRSAMPHRRCSICRGCVR